MNSLSQMKSMAAARVVIQNSSDFDVGPVFASAKPADRRIRITQYVGRDPSTIPRRQWAYPGLYVREFMTLTIAPGGLGKTGLSIIEALAMVTGRDLLEVGLTGPPLRVWFWNGEDPYVELERQVEAAKIHYDISDEDIGGRLFLNSGRDLPIKLASMAKGAATLLDLDIDEITAELAEKAIDVAIFDPFVTIHSVPESSNDAIDMVATALAQIANDTRVAMGIVVHTRKMGPGIGGEISSDDSRGASALVNKARVARVLNRMTPGEAEQAGLPSGHHLRYFRIGGEGNKQNLTPPSSDKSWCFNASVILPNGTETELGDSVRVVTKWDYPDAFDDVTRHHVDAVRRQIQVPPNGGANWRADVQSPHWAGKCIARVLNMDPETVGSNLVDKAGTAKIKKILRVWVENNVLQITQLPDANRQLRKCVVLGDLSD